MIYLEIEILIIISITKIYLNVTNCSLISLTYRKNVSHVIVLKLFGFQEKY